MHVIVFVMLAIYRLMLDLNPSFNLSIPSWVVGVTNIQLLAVNWSWSEAELLVAVDEEWVLW